MSNSIVVAVGDRIKVHDPGKEMLDKIMRVWPPGQDYGTITHMEDGVIIVHWESTDTTAPLGDCTIKEIVER